jgi:hypothetical protein
VTPDCFITTFEEVLQIPFEGYVSKTRNEVYLFQPQEGGITTNTLHRLNRSSCGDADLQDSWVMQTSGSNVTTGARSVQLGRLRFDGVGNITGEVGTNINGVKSDYTLSGTYNVDSDCTLSMSLTDENGIVSHVFGVFFDDASQFEFIYSDDGLVIPGTARQAADN